MCSVWGLARTRSLLPSICVRYRDRLELIQDAAGRDQVEVRALTGVETLREDTCDHNRFQSASIGRQAPHRDERRNHPNLTTPRRSANTPNQIRTGDLRRERLDFTT